MEIKIATEEHIEHMIVLNRNCLISNTNPNGFVRIAYNKQQLMKLIQLNELVVAMDGFRLAGYYLVGRNSENEQLIYQQNKAKRLFDTHQIVESKVGYGCQVFIDPQYRSNGVFGLMLRELCKLVSSKYTHLLCSVSDANTSSLRAHDNNGWQLIDTMETTKFLIYPTQRTAF